MNETVLQGLLRALSKAFSTRDTEGLLRLFSSTAGVTYAGSESGEKATGPAELRTYCQVCSPEPAPIPLSSPTSSSASATGLSGCSLTVSAPR